MSPLSWLPGGHARWPRLTGLNHAHTVVPYFNSPSNAREWGADCGKGRRGSLVACDVQWWAWESYSARCLFRFTFNTFLLGLLVLPVVGASLKSPAMREPAGLRIKV